MKNSLIMRGLAILGAMAVPLFIASCGQDQKEKDIDSLQGSWSAQSCIPRDSSSSRTTLTFAGDRYTLATTLFSDSDCTEKNETVGSTGTFVVSQTEKVGVPDSIIVTYDAVIVAFHTQKGVEKANDNLVIKKQALKKQLERETTAKETKQTEKKLAALNAVSEWKVDESKTLNFHQSGLLGEKGNLESIGSRDSMFYQIDENTLIIDGRKAYTRN